MGKNTTIKEYRFTQDLSLAPFSQTIDVDGALNNSRLAMIKIKSTEVLAETLTISTVETETNFNTILYTKTFTTGNNFVLTTDSDLVFKENSSCKIDITNSTNTGVVYVILYFDTI